MLWPKTWASFLTSLSLWPPPHTQPIRKAYWSYFENPAQFLPPLLLSSTLAQAAPRNTSITVTTFPGFLLPPLLPCLHTAAREIRLICKSESVPPRLETLPILLRGKAKVLPLSYKILCSLFPWFLSPHLLLSASLTHSSHTGLFILLELTKTTPASETSLNAHP